MPGVVLGPVGAECEGNPQRKGGERVAEVVDEVREKGNAVVSTNTSTCASAVTRRTMRLALTARRPARERRTLGSSKP